MSNPAVAALEANELVEEESGEPAALDASEIAAAPFHPQHSRGSAADGIGRDDFGAGVSSAEICYTEVGSQKIRAITKQFRLVKFRGQLRIPKIFQIVQFGNRGPRRSHEILQVGNAISRAIPIRV